MYMSHMYMDMSMYMSIYACIHVHMYMYRWTGTIDPLVASLETLPAGTERERVTDAFVSTLGRFRPCVQVVSVERVQSLPLWTSYQAKRHAILRREGNSEAVRKQNEREVLFHGVDETAMLNIIQQGFNRSFAGKNMCRYGKGTYFHIGAWYSAEPTYSRPNSQGIQHVLVCRVMVGAYCLGQNDARVPDVRKKGHGEGMVLYDSTVDDVKKPSIYVTYHDAQAYPEYLVRFRNSTVRV